MTDIKSLYETDYALWLDRTVTDLKARRLDRIDWENLIEEVESLSGRDKRELGNRLTTLFEHLLKRRYVNLPNCYRGWNQTIRRSQIRIKRLLKMSPSLNTYLIDSIDECYSDALKIVRAKYDSHFPEECPFPKDPDRLLNDTFWE
jgi:hypothetical protein